MICKKYFPRRYILNFACRHCRIKAMLNFTLWSNWFIGKVWKCPCWNWNNILSLHLYVAISLRITSDIAYSTPKIQAPILSSAKFYNFSMKMFPITDCTGVYNLFITVPLEMLPMKRCQNMTWSTSKYRVLNGISNIIPVLLCFGLTSKSLLLFGSGYIWYISPFFLGWFDGAGKMASGKITMYTGKSWNNKLIHKKTTRLMCTIDKT